MGTENSQSCNINGWIMMSTRENCFFERGTQPGFFYSKTGKSGEFGIDTERADVMVISGYGGKCVNGTKIKDQKPVCPYKGKEYNTGEKWEDGCDYNCQCMDAVQGFYQCTAKCLTFNNLPSECRLLAPVTGKCCPTVSCPPGIVINYPDGYVPQ